jgi:hypothetical protein
MYSSLSHASIDDDTMQHFRYTRTIRWGRSDSFPAQVKASDETALAVLSKMHRLYSIDCARLNPHFSPYKNLTILIYPSFVVITTITITMVAFRHVAVTAAACLFVAMNAGISSALEPINSIEAFAVGVDRNVPLVASHLVVNTDPVATAATVANNTLVSSPVAFEEEETGSSRLDPLFFYTMPLVLKPRGSEAFAVDFSPVPTAVGATDSTCSAYDFASSLLLDASNFIAVTLDKLCKSSAFGRSRSPDPLVGSTGSHRLYSQHHRSIQHQHHGCVRLESLEEWSVFHCR